MGKMKTEIDWLGLAGLFLVIEGTMSILASQDQNLYSNIGRVIRIGIGGYLVTY